LIFVGFALVLIGLNAGKGDPAVQVGVGGFIGPIPFGFANSPTILYIIIGLMAFIFTAWFLMRGIAT